VGELEQEPHLLTGEVELLDEAALVQVNRHVLAFLSLLW
jgi:hypothetical protein